MTDKKEPRLLYYIGKRTASKGGKLVDAFCELPSDDNFTYWPKAKTSHFSGARIGRQYDLTDGLPNLWSNAETGEKADPRVIETWQVESRSEQALKQQTKVDASPELTQAIETIQFAMQRKGRAQRMAFVAWLLNQLT